MAEIDLGKVTGINNTSHTAINGHIEFMGGLKILVGKDETSAYEGNVTFDTPFSNTCITVIAQTISNDHTSFIGVGNITKNGFHFKQPNQRWFTYIAIGF